MVSLLLVAAAVGVLAGQSRPTLRDLVQEKHGPVSILTSTDFTATTLDAVVVRSDVIVRGTVAARVKSYLSADERDVLTDYSLTNIQVIFPGAAAANSSPGVQPMSILTVTQAGGTASVEGQTVSVHHSKHPLEPGLDVVLFLRRDSGHLRIVADYLGVFTVEHEHVDPLSDNGAFDAKHRGQKLDDFLADILHHAP